MKETKFSAGFTWKKLPFTPQSTKAPLLILSFHTWCFCRFWWRHYFLNRKSSKSFEWGWKTLFHLTHFWVLASMSLIFVWDETCHTNILKSESQWPNSCMFKSSASPFNIFCSELSATTSAVPQLNNRLKLPPLKLNLNSRTFHPI